MIAEIKKQLAVVDFLVLSNIIIYNNRFYTPYFNVTETDVL